MKQHPSQDMASSPPRFGSILLVSVGFGGWFGQSMCVVRLLLDSDTSRMVPGVVIGLLAIPTAAVVAADIWFMSRATARSARGKIPTTPGKEATGPRWPRSPRTVAVIVPCGLLVYLALVGGMVELILWCRLHPWPDPTYWAAVLNGLFVVAIAGLVLQGINLAQALERWPGRHRHHRMTTTTRPGEPLWDRDLDHEFAADMGPVS